MAGKIYLPGRGPIVTDHNGDTFRLGVNNDGEVTTVRAHPLLTDELYPAGATPRFVQPNGTLLAFQEPFATPPESPDPAGTAPAGTPYGTDPSDLPPNGRPPLLGPDGNTFWSNRNSPYSNNASPLSYYVQIYSQGWFRIHAKTAHPITLDTELSYPDSYPSYYYQNKILVFEGGVANHGTAPVFGSYYNYYPLPIAQATATSSMYYSGTTTYGYPARLTFTPEVGHYYFIAAGMVFPPYYVNYYGYAAYTSHMNLRWAGINQ